MPSAVLGLVTITASRAEITARPPDLSIDAMDVSGDHQLDVASSVFKSRLTLEGKIIEEEPEKIQVGGGAEEEEGEGGSPSPDTAIDVKDMCKR